jgi:hypothetical protein
VAPGQLAALDALLAEDLAAQGLGGAAPGGVQRPLHAAVQALLETGWLTARPGGQPPGLGAAAAVEEVECVYSWQPGPCGPPGPESMVVGASSSAANAPAGGGGGGGWSAQYRQLSACFDGQRRLVADLQRTLAPEGNAVQRCDAGGPRAAPQGAPPAGAPLQRHTWLDLPPCCI